MITAILDKALANRFLVVISALLLAGAGIYSALHLPVDAVPDITNTQVQINTAVAGLAPEETEQLITYPLELALAGLQGVEEFRSLTKSGLSQVTLVFRDGVDVFRARQLVSERLVGVELPPGMKPQMSPISTGLGEILYYTLDYAADAPQRQQMDRKAQLMELRDTHDYVVKPFLRSVPGVAEVNSSGGYDRQLVVQPKPEALRDAGMTFAELGEIIGMNVENAGGGIIERGADRVLIRGVSKVRSLEDIASLPVKFAAGVEPLMVKDLAEVGIGSSVRTGCAVENGEEAVLGTVMMLVGENSRVISKRVEGKLEELQAKLPPGVITRVQYARSEVVDRTIATVKHNLIEGAVLVVVVLLALLGNWRAAWIVALAIPLSFLFALIGMTFGGVSGNLMSLGAVDFGLIIDGAVVMVENIVRVLAERQHHLGRRLTAAERLAAVKEASHQVGNPMFFGVLIITLVYLPILALTGIEGKMFHPMAITVMLALGGALVLALTLMPALCSLLLRSVSEKENFLIRWSKALYAPLLKLAWTTRWLLALATMALLAATAVLFMSLKQEFVPTLDEGSWTVMVYQPANTSLTTSLDRCVKTQRYLKDHVPEVTRTFARLGTSEVATDPMSPGEYDLYIFYKPQAEWRQEAGEPVSRERLAELITEELKTQVPEQEYDFAQPIQMKFNEMLEGSRADLSVRVFGQDFDTMEKIAGQMKELLEPLPGTSGAEFETEGRVPVLELRINRPAMVKYNVEASEVNAAITTAMAGHTAGTLMEHNRRREIVVRMPEKLRNDPEIMKALPVRTQDGSLVALGKLAEFVEVPQVDAIGRVSGQRRVALNVDLEGGTDGEAYVKAARAAMQGKVELPEGYRVEFGGQFEHLQEARERLMVVVPLALVLIFVLIHSAFGSVMQALIIYTGIPLAITGGVAALWVRDLPFSISAAIGFIALCGVAVLNGVVLISCFNQLRKEGMTLVDAVSLGSLQRLRPVLMTALVASLGFIPMAISTGAGAEVQRPLATVVIGGILSSTFLTLFLLPVLYRWFCAAKRAD